MPAGALLTSPEPRPGLVTVSVTELENSADTVWLCVIGTVHSPEPAHPPPLHPARAHPGAGVACRMTTLPEEKTSVQSPPVPVPHIIPPGMVSIAPWPDTMTERVTSWPGVGAAGVGAAGVGAAGVGVVDASSKDAIIDLF